MKPLIFVQLLSCSLIPLILSSCATNSSVDRAEQSAQQQDQSRRLSSANTEQYWRTRCGAGPSKSYVTEFECGDYLIHHDKSAAALRWRRAYDLAQERQQQCDAIERINNFALNPEAALDGVSPTVLQNCHDRQEESRNARIVRAQRDSCLAQCRSAESTCRASSGTNLITLLASRCESTRTSCESSCVGAQVQGE